MPKMRAKLKVTNVHEHINFGTEVKEAERLSFQAVYKSEAYDVTGTDEDNTYALFTPQAEFTMLANNPALFDQFKVGEKYYVDFTQAD